MGCNNVGDERLEGALVSPGPLPSNLVGDALQDIIDNRQRALPKGMAEAEYRHRVGQLGKSVVGDIGERAMAKVLEAAKHFVIGSSDKHDGRTDHRLLNDFTTIGPDGTLTVIDVKATAKGVERVRTNEYGGKNLPKPPLPKTASGIHQLDDQYNLVRMLDILSFEGEPPKHGEGAPAYAVKLDIALMTYQLWEVDANGKVTDPIGPQLSAAAEIAEALREELNANGEQWP
jgi:hypothetical protein